MPEERKILFIKGVFKHTHNVFNIIESKKPRIVYKKNMKTMKDWLDQPEICCATCTRKTDKHIFVPENVERGGEYTAHGTARFCSFPCASYHIMKHLKNDQRYKILLNALYKTYTGVYPVEIVPAVDPWEIEMFGGAKTMEEYHKLNEINTERFQACLDYSNNSNDAKQLNIV